MKILCGKLAVVSTVAALFGKASVEGVNINLGTNRTYIPVGISSYQWVGVYNWTGVLCSGAGSIFHGDQGLFGLQPTSRENSDWLPGEMGATTS